MTNFSILENKISTVKKYLKILEGYRKLPLKMIESDINIRGAVERYLYLAVQSTIDLAEAIISYKNYRKPSTFAESFHILEEEKIIAPKLTEKMAAMVGFRNVIAHAYEKINYDIVYDVLQNGVNDIKLFLGKIGRVK